MRGRLRDLDGPMKGIFGEETTRAACKRVIKELEQSHPGALRKGPRRAAGGAKPRMRPGFVEVTGGKSRYVAYAWDCASDPFSD
jgi:hypothetical protein